MAEMPDATRMVPLLQDPNRTANDPLNLEFGDCKAGWIRLRLPSLTKDEINATHLVDPFAAMLEWLEAIAAGADIAVWKISQEGSMARLIYSAAGDLCLADGEDRLIYIGDGVLLFGLAAAPVERKALVREFYEGFCLFTESEQYRPTEWESAMAPEEAAHIAASLDDGRNEDDLMGSWSGGHLRRLRSPRLDSFVPGSQAERPGSDVASQGAGDGA